MAARCESTGVVIDVLSLKGRLLGKVDPTCFSGWLHAYVFSLFKYFSKTMPELWRVVSPLLELGLSGLIAV